MGETSLPPGLPRAELEGGETPDGDKSGAQGVIAHVLENLPRAETELDDLPDYSQDVAELATNKNLVWCSMDKPEDFKKNGKVNFLHLSDDGVFTLTVIKPGTKTPYTATIPQDVVPMVRENLIGLQKRGWDKRFSKEDWNDERGDVDGNTYSFKRFINIAPGFDLFWEGEHTNQGVKVVVNDKLYLVPLPGLTT